MKLLSILSLLIALAINSAAQDPFLILSSNRPPELEVGSFKQIAIGEINGSLGARTELSMDFADALSSRIFSANTLEVVDKGTLDKLLGEQKYRDLQIIDDATTRQINQKLGSALLITGRMMSDKLEQNLIYADQSVVLNNCATTYYYQVKGTVGINLKIFDLKTGKLIFNDPVVLSIDKRTETECKIPNKLDVGEITRQSVRLLAEKVSALVVPYEVKTKLQFVDPGLLKSPFKRLREAVLLLQNKNSKSGLEILKGYTEAKDVKQKHLAPALFNYSLGLIYAGELEAAKPILEKSLVGGYKYEEPVTVLTEFIAKEIEARNKLARQKAEREKAEQEALAKPVSTKTTESDKPASKQPAAKSKSTAAAKTKN